MSYRPRPPVIDMSLDGPVHPTRSRTPFAARLAGVAVVVAVLCTLLSVAALAILIASFLIPVAVAAGLVAWAAFRFRRWQAGTGRAPAPAVGRPFVMRWPPR